MNEFHCVTVCAALAVVLVGVILVALTINPWAALGLAPVLLAIAAIIRAVRGGPHDGGDEPPGGGATA